MKYLKSKALFAFTFLIITSSAQATIISMTQVEVRMTTYNVMTVFGAYSDDPAFWESQPWWGEEDFAREFAAAIGNSLGAPNTGIGPYFMYADLGGNEVEFAYCPVPTNCDNAENEVATDFTGYDDTFYFTKASVVPIPAAAWLFMSGLLGLLWKGRKAAYQSVA